MKRILLITAILATAMSARAGASLRWLQTVADFGAFAESKFRSAPYFNLRIDGITELG